MGEQEKQRKRQGQKEEKKVRKDEEREIKISVRLYELNPC